jgi:phosphoketolase
MTTNLLNPEAPQAMHRYRRAANSLSAGQIYLYDNPLLKKPLELSQVKPLVVGHWGATPFDRRGQNDLDRFHLAQDVVDRIAHFGSIWPYLEPLMTDKLLEHKLHMNQHGLEMRENRDRKWYAAGRLNARLA